MIKLINKYSTEKEILDYIETHSMHFLFISESDCWPMQYINAAAEIASKNYGLNFLYYFNEKKWAIPYLEVASNRAMEEDCCNFVYYFFDKPWAKPYLNSALEIIAKNNPEYYIDKLSVDYPDYMIVALYSIVDKNC